MASQRGLPVASPEQESDYLGPDAKVPGKPEKMNQTQEEWMTNSYSVLVTDQACQGKASADLPVVPMYVLKRAG